MWGRGARQLGKHSDPQGKDRILVETEFTSIERVFLELYHLTVWKLDMCSGTLAS